MLFPYQDLADCSDCEPEQSGVAPVDLVADIYLDGYEDLVARCGELGC